MIEMFAMLRAKASAVSLHGLRDTHATDVHRAGLHSGITSARRPSRSRWTPVGRRSSACRKTPPSVSTPRFAACFPTQRVEAPGVEAPGVEAPGVANGGAGRPLGLGLRQRCRVSTVVVQRFCKPKVGGSNPSPGRPSRKVRDRASTF